MIRKIQKWGIIFIILVMLTIFYAMLIHAFFTIEKGNDSKRDLIVLLQLFVTSFISLVTSFMAFLTYRLQRQGNYMTMERINETKLMKANNILYYLEDTVKKLANINFNDNELSKIFKSSREYRGDLNFLRQNLLTLEEADFIKEIFDYVDDFSNYLYADEKDRLFKVKPLYKMIIDLYIPPLEIKKNKVKGDLDYVVNLKLLAIILKLRMYINSEYNDLTLPRVKNKNLILELRGNEILIKKIYDDKHYLHYFKAKEMGVIRKFEPFFTQNNNNSITITYEQVYEGEIKNNRFNGTGRYDYYTQINGFKDKLNSCELQTEGLNFDANAQYICNKLTNHEVSVYVRAYFEGEFRNGMIKKGNIFYKEKPNTKYQLLEKID